MVSMWTACPPLRDCTRHPRFASGLTSPHQYPSAGLITPSTWSGIPLLYRDLQLMRRSTWSQECGQEQQNDSSNGSAPSDTRLLRLVKPLRILKLLRILRMFKFTE